MGATDDGTESATSTDRLVEEFLTAFVGGDAEAIADLVTDDCALHQPRWPLTRRGKAAIVEATRANAGTFTDLAVTTERSVADGDELAAYVTARGRNVGPMRMEDREIAPTGRTFEIPQFGHYRVEDGRIAEAWILADALGLVEQLDNLPTGPGKLLSIVLRQVRWRLGGRKHLE